MQTSGLVLDIYDDFQGEVLRSVYPEQGAIPDFVKSAQVLSAEDHDRLPDDAFALVLVNEGQRLRKYACIDRGNTELATQFFLKTAHKLPVEAQKVAAENIRRVRAWYGMDENGEIHKIAMGLGTAITALTAVPILSGTHQEIKERREATNALGGDGRVVTPEERDRFRSMMKSADVTGTADMPYVASTTPSASKTVVKKVAGAAAEPDLVPPVSGENPTTLPQGKTLRPHVDVSNKEPPKVVTEKKAEAYALPALERYPLDSYVHVKTAGEYFDQYGRHMDPESRHEYCVNLVKRADALGIPVSFDIRKYGSEGYAPSEELELGYNCRRNALLADPGDASLSLLDALYEKRASVEPDVFCLALSEFDKHAAIDFRYDRGILDPYYSTFGSKTAAAWSEVMGNDMVTEQDLRRLAKIGQKALKSTFTEEFASEFRKDPVGIFKSLPRDQKKILMRMAVDNIGPGIELMA